jgi:filamentous hemagglutinin family protein
MHQVFPQINYWDAGCKRLFLSADHGALRKRTRPHNTITGIMDLIRRCLFTPFAALFLAGLIVSTSHAEVTFDGSLGPAGALSGPDFAIRADMGKQVDTNLFHSFGEFNIFNGESATFTGDGATGSIENVLGRVTGGSNSTIDGLLRSTIPGADLFLINPAGIMFGPNAQLDVNGSFHASTADFIRLENGVVFNAVPSPDDALLTAASPQAFGFYGENPASLTIEGSNLEVRSGQTLSLVGGNIQITGGQLSAPNGHINLVSVASRGDVLLSDKKLSAELFEQFGEVDIAQGGSINTTGEGGGSICIQGGKLSVSDSVISSDTLGVKDGLGIDLNVKDLSLKDGAEVSAETSGSGAGGNITVTSKRVQLVGPQTQLYVGALGVGKPVGTIIGNAGNIKINTGLLSVSDNARISARNNVAHGSGANINIDATQVLLEQDASLFTSLFRLGTDGESGAIRINADALTVTNGASIGSQILSGTGGNLEISANSLSLQGIGTDKFTGINYFSSGGDIGNIQIDANSLIVGGGAKISMGTFFIGGEAGDIDISANNILLDGPGSGIFIEGSGGLDLVSDQNIDIGDTGNIRIETGTMEITAGAQILAASFFGLKDKGNIDITANRIFLDGQNSGLFATAAEISPPPPLPTFEKANSGDITVRTDSLKISNGASISTRSIGQGRGGDIIIDASNIEVKDGGLISSQSESSELNAGESGEISINAQDSLVVGGGSISVQTRLSSAGDIKLQVGRLLYLQNQSSITTSVAGGEGSGGNISIDPAFVILNDSQIVAQAELGGGGNIQTDGDFIIVSADSRIDASSRFGIDGTVRTTTPQRDLQKGLVELPAELFDASSLIQGTCEARHVRGESRFTQTGRGGLPPGADEFPPAFYSIDNQDSGASDVNGAVSLSTMSATRGFANLLPTQVVLACGGHK